ncbi:MAG: hypothetical protein HXO13_06650 [Prevotella salivae]|jgi:hypothetical protein|nr:hypothetical protein [Segatella salivae]DAE73959.1 MAG TPA: hypothetical protein [Caudoviricetes sp.]
MSSSLNDILGSKPAANTQSPPQPASPAKGMKTETAVSAAGVAQQQAENAHLRENGAVPTTQAGNISGNNTAPSVSIPIAPSIEQSVAAKGEEKMIPAAAPIRMSYVDMFTKLNPYQPPTQEELENERKKEKREKVFSAISDGISALSNLYFTTKYAPNMYRHENSQSAKTENKWEKLRANRDAQQNAYIRNLMAARQADDERKDKDRNWMRQLGIDMYNQEKDAAEFQYKKDRDATKDDQWKQDYDQRDRHFTKTIEHKEKVLEEDIRSHKANERLQGAKVAETGRHNRVSEAQGAARISQAESHFRATHNADGTTKGSAKDNGYHLTIGGKTYTYETENDYNKAVVREARKRGISLTWGTSKNKYTGEQTGTPKLRTIVGLASELEEKFGGKPNQAASKSTSSGGFNVNSYRRGAKKPVKKTTSSTNRPPLN